MEARLVKQEDFEDLKEIWKLSFGDPDSFIDFYYQNRDWISETAVLVESRKVVSMLTMIPVEMIDQGGGKSDAAMLYAIATHPDYQKRGYADRLIEFSNQYLLSKQIAITLLVPASESLFDFYGKRGYRDGFYVREAVLSRKDIDQLPGEYAPCRFVPIKPMEYNAMRRRLLEGHPYLNYRDDEILFQKQLTVMFDADLYAIVIGGEAGCAYAERISEEEVILKELLIRDPFLIPAVKRITELLPAEKYIIRTPAHAAGILGGKVRPFGMFRANRISGANVSADPYYDLEESYLGIAYD